MSDCIFCAIAARTAPARIVFEDERTLAFMDIAPLTPGHALVIPKRHAENIFEIDPDELAAVTRTTHLVCAAAKRAFEPDGLNLFQTNGAVAMQSVFHLHVHVLPRYRDDGFRVTFDRRMGGDDELDEAAATLRNAL